MKKFIAFIVALICVFAMPFSACKFLEIDFGDGFFNQADGDGSELEQPNDGEEDGGNTDPENPSGGEEDGGNTDPENPNGGDNNGGNTEPETPNGGDNNGGNTEPETPNGGDNNGGNTEPENPNGGDNNGGNTEPENPSGGDNNGGNTEPEKPNGGDDKKEEEKPHECTYDYSAWSSDNTHHWHASTCHEHPDGKIDYDSHNFINNRCIVCNKIKLDDSVNYVKLPNFTVETYNSSYKKGTFSSADALGKVLVINFWYTTCGVCNDEMPDVEKLNETYGNDIVVIAIHKDNGEQIVAQSHINALGWSNYKTIFGKDYKANGVDAIAKMCGIAGSDYPVTVVVDRQGYIIYTQMGNFMYFDMETFQYTNLLAPYIEAALAR